MNYTILLKRSVEKELERLDPKAHDKIIKHLLALKENPLPKGVKKLQVREGYRIRVGDYRILYHSPYAVIFKGCNFCNSAKAVRKALT